MMGAAGVAVGAWLLTAGREARCDALKKSRQGLVFGFQLFLPPGLEELARVFHILHSYLFILFYLICIIMRRRRVKRRKKIKAVVKRLKGPCDP